MIVIYGLKIEISISQLLTFRMLTTCQRRCLLKNLSLRFFCAFWIFFFKICSEFVPFNKAVWRHCDLTGPETVFGRTRKSILFTFWFSFTYFLFARNSTWSTWSHTVAHTVVYTVVRHRESNIFHRTLSSLSSHLVYDTLCWLPGCIHRTWCGDVCGTSVLNRNPPQSSRNPVRSASARHLESTQRGFHWQRSRHDLAGLAGKGLPNGELSSELT